MVSCGRSGSYREGSTTGGRLSSKPKPFIHTGQEGGTCKLCLCLEVFVTDTAWGPAFPTEACNFAQEASLILVR